MLPYRFVQYSIVYIKYRDVLFMYILFMVFLTKSYITTVERPQQVNLLDDRAINFFFEFFVFLIQPAKSITIYITRFDFSFK